MQDKHPKNQRMEQNFTNTLHMTICELGE